MKALNSADVGEVDEVDDQDGQTGASRSSRGGTPYDDLRCTICRMKACRPTFEGERRGSSDPPPMEAKG